MASRDRTERTGDAVRFRIPHQIHRPRTIATANVADLRGAFAAADVAIVGLVAILLVGSMAVASERLFVASPRDPQGERRGVVLWDSASSAADCGDSINARMRKLSSDLEAGGAQARKATKRMDLTGADACRQGEIGKLTHATALDAIEPLDECEDREDRSKFVKARVASGALQGKVGCVLRSAISVERQP